MSIPLLDLRGLKCPLPVLRTRKALRNVEAGTALVVLTTDALAGLDLAALAQEIGAAYRNSVEPDGHMRHTLVPPHAEPQTPLEP